jgi:hypothetical protein
MPAAADGPVAVASLPLNKPGRVFWPRTASRSAVGGLIGIGVAVLIGVIYLFVLVIGVFIEFLQCGDKSPCTPTVGLGMILYGGIALGVIAGAFVIWALALLVRAIVLAVRKTSVQAV